MKNRLRATKPHDEARIKQADAEIAFLTLVDQHLSITSQPCEDIATHSMSCPDVFIGDPSADWRSLLLNHWTFVYVRERDRYRSDTWIVKVT